jgi:uncharacterized protein (TIGR02246 family)
MKKLLLCAVLLGITAIPVLSRAEGPAARANQKDEDAVIQKRHDEWVAAWNSHDPKVMASFWLVNGDLIDPFGRHAQGRQAIEKLFEAEHTGTGVMVGTTYAGTVENIRYIGKNVAIVDVTAEVSGMKGPDGAAMPPFKHHVTWVAEKKNGKWMAFAARPCVAVPPPVVAAAAPAPAPAK